MSAAVLTYEQHCNERRMRRLRDHYTATLRQREHTELAVRARLAQEFDGDIPGEVDAVISEELAQRRLNRIMAAQQMEVAL